MSAEGKLLFAVPLISAQVATSWPRVQQLLERTLRSVCAQTSPRFQVVVACHERPEIGFEHPAVHYHPVDLPIPANDHEAKRWDKRVKIRLALHAGRDLGATHAMVVDADDCVSRRLAGFVSRRPEADGWFLRTGYFYSERSGALYLRRGDFYCWTETSLIVRQGLYPRREALDASDFGRPGTLEETWWFSHRRGPLEVGRRGGRLRPLRFPGAVYVVEHGANLGSIRESGYRLRALPFRLKRAIFNDRRLTPRIREEFGLHDLAPMERAR